MAARHDKSETLVIHLAFLQQKQSSEQDNISCGTRISKTPKYLDTNKGSISDVTTLSADQVETLVIDRASSKINNREKNVGAILFFCPTRGMQFHLKIRIFCHSAL